MASNTAYSTEYLTTERQAMPRFVFIKLIIDHELLID